MFKNFKPRNFIVFLLLGLLCLFYSIQIDQSDISLKHKDHRAILKEKFKRKLNAEVNAMNVMLAMQTDSFITISNSSNKKYIHQIYQGDSIISWDDNAIETIDIYKLESSPRILELKNGIYLVEKKKQGRLVHVLFYRIISNYEISNAYLKNDLNPDFEITQPCFIRLTPATNYDAIQLKESLTCFVNFEIQPEASRSALFLFILAFLFLCLSIKHLCDYLFKKDFVLGFTFLLVISIAFRVMMSYYHLPKMLFASEIFNPRYFASSEFFPSFGDLVLMVSFFVLDTVVALYYFEKLKTQKLFQTATLGRSMLLICIFNFAYLTFKIIYDLVIDSKIAFDLTNVFDLSWLSLAGVLIILLMYIVTISLSHLYFKFSNNKESHSVFIIQLLLLLFWIFIFGFFQKEDYFGWKLAATIIFLVLLVFAKKAIAPKRFLVRHLLYGLIFVNVSAISFYFDINEKAKADSILYASRLTTQIDYRSEEILREKEKEIIADTTFLNFCLTKPESTELKQIITSKFINNYLDKYDCNAFLFLNDTASASFSGHMLTELESIYKNQGILGLGNNFRFVKSPSDFFGYIGRFETKRNGTNIKLFIKLKLPPYQQDNYLPILLAGKPTTFMRNKLEYSYAIYNNKTLMQQGGSFQFQTTYNFDSITSSPKSIFKDGYSHLLYRDSEALLVVITSRAPSLFSILANALCLYIGLLLLGFLWVALSFILLFLFSSNKYNWGKDRVKYAWRNNLIRYDLIYFRFSTRIIINILSLVLFIFTVTTIVTIDYINSKIKEEARVAFISKLKAINRYITEEKMLQSDNLKGEAEAKLLKASALFTTDINVYDARGKLFLSSKPEIFNSGLLSNRINYFAYSNIINQKASLFTENENIGSLLYTSYYQPYYDRNSNTTFIINTPYFTRSIEHNAQISLFIINFLNLYVALLILMFVISYWVAQRTTQPLLLLRDKLKVLRLDRENEFLHWIRNDEIGELSREYNKMVIDLKESKENLAKSERTEAWREMAKQVAHDIKNPLTPMKLNLQYLQKAIENQDPDLNDKYLNVSQSLIRQIDSLTDMANNFSNFARVPQAFPEIITISEELNALISLYGATEFMQITSRYKNEFLKVYMDKNHFSRAIGNILKNAIQAVVIGNQGDIEVALEEESGSALITIRDNGIGISEAMEPFVFVPNFSTKTSGSGIGLSTSKTLIEHAGGSISFQSKPQEGTKFFIRLPLKS